MPTILPLYSLDDSRADVIEAAPRATTTAKPSLVLTATTTAVTARAVAKTALHTIFIFITYLLSQLV